MKTPEEMAMEYINDVETPRNPSVAATAFPQMQRCFLAGYKAAKEEEATKDQKIAELWTESIRRMLPSVHEITLFPSKRSEDK
jgi:hypothetical protein